MLRRIVQISVLVAGIAASSVSASGRDADREMTCREYCYFAMGLCAGSGGTWDFTCEMIDPEYVGECSLGSPCIYS